MGRNTKQKSAILRVVRSALCHPDAGWVYEQVRKEIPRISLGTVYRNLRQLRESGAILEIGGQGTLNCFDGKVEPHYHFRCRECGSIFDLDEEVNHEIEKRVTRRTGFKVTEYNLELRGICLDCQKAVPESEAIDSNKK